MIGALYRVRIRNQSSGARRASLTLLVASVALLVPTLTNVRAVGALLDPFAMSPAAGPPGTVVHVGGTGCAPGIAVSPTQDQVNVTSTALSFSTNLPVAANGSWSGSIAVPATAPAGPGLVVAACFTDGLPSLVATYAPRTFTVTSAPAPVGGTTPTTTHSTPTTAPTPPATIPRATPTTLSTGATPGSPTGGSTPSGNGGAHPGPGTTAVGGPGGTGTPHGGTGVGTAADRPARGTGKHSGTAGALAPSRPNVAETASAAGLPEPSLARASRNDGGDPVWRLWLILFVLVAAASALLWWWQRRPPGDSEPAGEAL